MTRYNNNRHGESFLIRSYMAEALQYPLLTKEQETELGNRVRKGNRIGKVDLEARTPLINSNLRLVVKIANYYSSATGVPQMDLIQEGNIGLMKAVDKFNPKDGRLTTYAKWWIKKDILKYITVKGYGVKKPANRGDIKFEFHHLDAPVKVCEGKDKYIELYEHTPSEEPSPLECTIKNDRIAIIRKSLGILNEKDRMIVEILYGMRNRREVTQEEIAKKFGVTRQAVEKILREKILPKLREHLEGHKYKATFADI